VLVHDAKEAVVHLLELHPLLEGPEIVPEVSLPAWLHSTENALPHHPLQVCGCGFEERLT
jgi:hypothetical protein